jgi:hypothetical protein
MSKMSDKYNKPNQVTFPIWMHPNWVLSSGEFDPQNDVCEELFNSKGRLVGMIQPHGTIWVTYEVQVGHQQAQVIFLVVGHYFYKHQAKAALESRFAVVFEER